MHASTMIASALQASLFLAVAALISWKLAALAILIGSAMFLSFGKMVTQSRNAARRHRAQMRQLAANFTDAMIGIKPIRAMGRTERFSRLFEADARGIAETLRTRVVSSEYVSEMQEPVIGCLFAVGFYYATQGTSLNAHDIIIMAILLVRTIGLLGPMQKTFQRFIQSLRPISVTEEPAEGNGGCGGGLGRGCGADLRTRHPVRKRLFRLWRKARAGRPRIGNPLRLDHRSRRAVGGGQVDDHRPHRRPLPAAGRPHSGRWCRPERNRPATMAPYARLRAAGGDSLPRHHLQERQPVGGRSDRGRCDRRPACRRRLGVRPRNCRKVCTKSSASAAIACPAGSARGSRSREPWCTSPAC